MKKMFFMVLLATISALNPIAAQTKADTVSQKVQEVVSKLSFGLEAGVGKGTYSSLSLAYDSYKLEYSSILQKRYLDFSYDFLSLIDSTATAQFRLGLGSGFGNLALLTAEFKSEEFQLLPNWGIIQSAYFRAKVFNGFSTKNEFSGERLYNGAFITQLAVKPEWEWFNNFLGENSDKRIILTAGAQREKLPFDLGSQTDWMLTVGYSATFGYQKPTETAKDFGLNVPTDQVPKVPKKAEKAPTLEELSAQADTTSAKDELMDGFPFIAVIAIIEEGKPPFIAEMESNENIAQNLITDIDHFGDRLWKVSTEKGVCHFFFPQGNDEVTLTFGEKSYHLQFTVDDAGLFVAKDGKVDVMVALQE